MHHKNERRFQIIFSPIKWQNTLLITINSSLNANVPECVHTSLLRLMLTGTRRLATVTRSRISFRALTKTFSFSRRRSRPRTKFTLQITMLIDYCLWYYVRACRRDQAFVDAGILWKYAPFNTCYYAKFGRSRSNGTRVITEIRHKHLTPRVLPFNVTQSHRIDRLPVISY